MSSALLNNASVIRTLAACATCAFVTYNIYQQTNRPTVEDPEKVDEENGSGDERHQGLAPDAVGESGHDDVEPRAALAAVGREAWLQKHFCAMLNAFSWDSFEEYAFDPSWQRILADNITWCACRAGHSILPAGAMPTAAEAVTTTTTAEVLDAVQECLKDPNATNMSNAVQLLFGFLLDHISGWGYDCLGVELLPCPGADAPMQSKLLFAYKVYRVLKLLRKLANLISWPAGSAPAFDEKELDELTRANTELLQAISDAEEQLQSDSAHVVGPGPGGASSITIPLTESVSGHNSDAALDQAFAITISSRDEIVHLLLSHRRARAGRRTMANTYP